MSSLLDLALCPALGAPYNWNEVGKLDVQQMQMMDEALSRLDRAAEFIKQQIWIVKSMKRGG